MNLTVHKSGLSLTTDKERFLKGLLKNYLRRLSHKLVRVDVYLRDVNGPKGGPDKSVVICSQVAGQPPIAVNVIRSSLTAAVRVAAKLARERVKRVMRKQRSAMRYPPKLVPQ